MTMRFRSGVAAVLVLGLLLAPAVTPGLATAQSITAAPPPPADLVLMQRRVADLETALREANRTSDDLSRENFRLRQENDRLKAALATAEQAARAPAGGPAPFSTGPAPGPMTAPAPVSAPPAATPPANDAETAAFNQAVSLALQNPAAAEIALRNFLQTYPNSTRTGEATYFLGRTQYVQGKWNAAAQTFLDIVQKTPRARRAPESLIWLGVSLREDGVGSSQASKIRTGCGLLRELPERYPNAPQSVRDQARNELAKSAVPGGPAICGAP